MKGTQATWLDCLSNPRTYLTLACKNFILLIWKVHGWFLPINLLRMRSKISPVANVLVAKKESGDRVFSLFKDALPLGHKSLRMGVVWGCCLHWTIWAGWQQTKEPSRYKSGCHYGCRPLENLEAGREPESGWFCEGNRPGYLFQKSGWPVFPFKPPHGGWWHNQQIAVDQINPENNRLPLTAFGAFLSAIFLLCTMILTEHDQKYVSNWACSGMCMPQIGLTDINFSPFLCLKSVYYF